MDSQKETQKGSLTISDIRARAVHAPLERRIRTASGSIEVSPLLLVDVHTKQGVSGHAYLFGYTPATLRPLLALVDELRPELVGQPVVPVERMAQLQARFRLLGMQGLLGMLASTLDMAIVAEGLETVEQVEAVRAAGCTLGQGYYFSRAVPDHLAAMLIAQEREGQEPHRATG